MNAVMNTSCESEDPLPESRRAAVLTLDHDLLNVC